MSKTIHGMYFEAMEPYRGLTLSTKKIGEIVRGKFPDYDIENKKPILPNDHSDVGNEGQCWCAQTDNRIFTRIGNRGRYQVFHKETIADDINSIEASSEIQTTKKTLIDARLGQGKFRENLIEYWGCCAVTGITLVPILKASHIQPWRNSNNLERLDPFNGLLLSPTLDALFDQGYVSFSDSGTIIISPLIENQANKLDVKPAMSILKSKLTKEHYKYLAFHRDNIYIKIK